MKEVSNNCHYRVKTKGVGGEKVSHGHLPENITFYCIYVQKQHSLQPLRLQFPTFSTGHHLANISSHIITHIWTSEHTAQPSYGWRAFMMIHATHLYIHLITSIKMGEHNLQQWYIHIFPQQKILILPLFSSRIITNTRLSTKEINILTHMQVWPKLSHTHTHTMEQVNTGLKAKGTHRCWTVLKQMAWLLWQSRRHTSQSKTLCLITQVFTNINFLYTLFTVMHRRLTVFSFIHTHSQTHAHT